MTKISTTKIRDYLRFTGQVVSASTAGAANFIRVYLRDEGDDILMAAGISVPTDDTAGYAKGCLFIDTNVAKGSQGLYVNIGTDAECTFVACSDTTSLDSTLTATLEDGKYDSFSFSANIADVSTSGSTFSAPSPLSGTLTGIMACLNAAIASGDAGLSFKIGSGTVSGGAITIVQSGSAAGDVYSAMTLTANTTLAPGTVVECVSDGGSTNTAPVAVTFLAKHS